MSKLEFTRNMHVCADTDGVLLVKIQRSSAKTGHCAFVLVYNQSRTLFLEGGTTLEMYELTGPACKVFAYALFAEGKLVIGQLADLQEW